MRDVQYSGHLREAEPLPVQRVVAGVGFGVALKSQTLAAEALEAAISFLNVNSEHAGSAVVVGSATLPSRATLQRGRVRFDVAAMLWRRFQWACERRVVFRYLAYDASPQGGVEVFATVERVVTLPALGAPVEVHERRLPLVTLGHGRTTLSDKVQAHIHQTWLEYGPGLDTIQRANSVVRHEIE